MLVKLFSIGAIGFMGFKGVKLGAEQMGFFVDMTASVTALAEVKGIAKMIYLDHVLGTNSLPDISDEEWANYIRLNMHSDITVRDTSKDAWLTPYRVRGSGNLPGRGVPGFEVRSAGPDKAFGTKDDIAASYEY